VGRGAAGIVYRAYDLHSERIVALKVIASEAGDAPEEEARFTREGQLLENLDHPGIVKTVGFGVFEESGLPFVAMEWLEGEDLTARQKREPLTIPQALDLSMHVAEALQAAHAAGVIHRDIKPGNLFLCKAPGNEGFLGPWRVKLVDFGVAAKSDIRITRTGDVVGTPAYMAPEQARGDAPIDARCDIYSLGATLFELIAGRPPHVGPTVIATLARLVTTAPPRLSELRRDTPPAIDNLVSSMLHTDPASRPSSMSEVLTMLHDASGDVERMSWMEHVPDPRSSRLGSSASRLVTSIVAIRFATPSARERALEQLRQRITVSYHLEPLDADETSHYINHRLALASTGAPLSFPRQVTDRIFDRSGGVPRLINVIADATLVFGYGEERSEIDGTLIEEVITDLDATGVLGPRSNPNRHESVVPADPAAAAALARHNAMAGVAPCR